MSLRKILQGMILIGSFSLWGASAAKHSVYQSPPGAIVGIVNNQTIYPLVYDSVVTSSSSVYLSDQQGNPYINTVVPFVTYQDTNTASQQYVCLPGMGSWCAISYNVFTNVCPHSGLTGGIGAGCNGSYVDTITLTVGVTATQNVPVPDGYSIAYSNSYGSSANPIYYYVTYPTTTVGVANGPSGTVYWFPYTKSPWPAFTIAYQPTIPQLPTPPTYGVGTSYRGINLPGCDFPLSGVLTGDYVFPTSSTQTWFNVPLLGNAYYYLYKHLNYIRLPFAWENLANQPDFSQPGFDLGINFANPRPQAYAQLVNQLTAVGFTVICDMHNYMRYPSTSYPGQYTTYYPIGASDTATEADFVNAWGSLANEFKTNPKVMFDLMNEPWSVSTDPTSPEYISTENVLTLYNAAMAEIRSKGFTGTILLEGNGWTCLGTWITGMPSQGYTPNAEVFTASSINDSNYFINVHQYFNGAGCLTPCPDQACGSGETSNCVAADMVLTTEHFSDFLTYMASNNFRVILTEFGNPPNENCTECVSTYIAAVEANAYTEMHNYGFMGWSPWAATNINSTDILNIVPYADLITYSPAGSNTNPTYDSTQNTFHGQDKPIWPNALDRFLLPPYDGTTNCSASNNCTTYQAP